MEHLWYLTILRLPKDDDYDFVTEGALKRKEAEKQKEKARQCAYLLKW